LALSTEQASSVIASRCFKFEYLFAVPTNGSRRADGSLTRSEDPHSHFTPESEFTNVFNDISSINAEMTCAGRFSAGWEGGGIQVRSGADFAPWQVISSPALALDFVRVRCLDEQESELAHPSQNLFAFRQNFAPLRKGKLNRPLK
jgi:hypothetical protein